MLHPAAGTLALASSVWWGLASAAGAQPPGPLTLDPATLRVAFRVPEAIGVRTNSATLIFGWWRDGAEDSKQIETYHLLATTTARDLGPLERQAASGAHFFVYQLDRSDAPRMRALQRAAVEAGKRAPGANSAMFQFNELSCRLGEPPEGALPIAIFVRADDEIDYRLFRQLDDMRASWQKNATLEESLPLCGKMANRAD